MSRRPSAADPLNGSETRSGREGAGRRVNGVRGIPALAVGVALWLSPLLLPAAGSAQMPSNWVSVWAGVVPDPGTVVDDESGTVWDFGTSFAAGGGVQTLVGNTLLVGLDVGYSPVKHEVRRGGAVEADGRAHLVTTMVTGRLGAGGGGDFGTYLTGGLGAVTYGIPSLDRWDPDFSFRGGGGLEYRHARRVAFFIEWNRWWIFHQSQGVDDSTIRNSNFQFGARYGL